jgi:hypothetical protein
VIVKAFHEVTAVVRIDERPGPTYGIEAKVTTGKNENNAPTTRRIALMRRLNIISL